MRQTTAILNPFVEHVDKNYISATILSNFVMEKEKTSQKSESLHQSKQSASHKTSTSRRQPSSTPTTPTKKRARPETDMDGKHYDDISFSVNIFFLLQITLQCITI